MSEPLAEAVVAAARAGQDPNVPVLREGRLVGVNAAGHLWVDVGDPDRPVEVAQDSRFPRPVDGAAVVLLHVLGRHVIVAAPGVPAAGAETTAQRVTVSNDPAPTGQGWQEIAASWTREGADGVLERWDQRVTAAPVPAAAVTVGAVFADSYRSGAWRNVDQAIQGTSPQFGGENTGIWLLDPAALAAVQAGTWSRAVLTVHRGSGGVYGAQTPQLWTHAHAAKPVGAPSLALPWAPPSGVAVNSIGQWEISAGWVAAFTAGAALGVGVQGSAYMRFNQPASIVFYP